MVQNKSKRESKEVKAKELQDLRKENQQLRRENSRLRRDLDKRLSYEPDTNANTSDAGLEIAEIIQIPSTMNKECCPNCSSTNIGKMDLGHKEITVCKICKWRKISA
jgi:regulator of replication initiation timing